MLQIIRRKAKTKPARLKTKQIVVGIQTNNPVRDQTVTLTNLSGWSHSAPDLNVLGGIISIGYGKQCHINITGKQVEHLHCLLIRQANGDFIARNLGKPETVAVNGHKVRDEIQIIDRDILRVGSTCFQFRNKKTPRPRQGHHLRTKIPQLQ